MKFFTAIEEKREKIEKIEKIEKSETTKVVESYPALLIKGCYVNRE